MLHVLVLREQFPVGRSAVAGGRSVNRYGALSKGNLDDDEPLFDARHLVQAM